MRQDQSKVMINQSNYGQLNGHSVGIIMKEMVRRSTVLIRQKRNAFVSKEKDNPYKDAQDFVTDVDVAAQRLYIAMIKENFPGIDIVAEEDIPELPKPTGTELCITIDPLDGTKAFIRQQSDGVGSLLSLVQGDEIIAAFVGDINTQELYYFRPGSDTVHRISYIDEIRSVLNDVLIKPFEKTSLLMTDNTDVFTEFLPDTLFKLPQNGGLFKDVQILSGSIGTIAAKLWKGEVGALLLKPLSQQPWDIYPVIGISQKLGYVFGVIKANKLKIIDMPINRKPIDTDSPVLIIHQDSVSQLNNWLTLQ